MVRGVTTKGPKADAAEAALNERLDKWLWFARVVKTRTLASSLIEGGKIRLNGARVIKPSQSVKPGDTLTVAAHHKIRVLEIIGLAERRGSASIATQLYRELTERPAVAIGANKGAAEPGGGHAGRLRGTGRPTKKDRREIDRLKARSL